MMMKGGQKGVMQPTIKPVQQVGTVISPVLATGRIMPQGKQPVVVPKPIKPAATPALNEQPAADATGATGESKKKKKKSGGGGGGWGGGMPELMMPMTDEAQEQMSSMVQDFARLCADMGTSDEKLEKIFNQLQVARMPFGLAYWMTGQAQGGAPAGNGAGDIHLSDEETAKRKEQIIRLIVTRLQKGGGEQKFSDVANEPTIAGLRKGCVANISKFLMEFPENFEFKNVPNPEEGKGQIRMIRLIKPVPVGAVVGAKRKRDEMSKADRQEALLQSLADTLAEAGGSATVSDLGLDPRVQAARVNVNTTLGKFMGSSPEVFTVENDPAGNARASLLVSPAAAVTMANLRAKLEAS